jgi:transcriptional regulator with XRE-family HTH domain
MTDSTVSPRLGARLRELRQTWPDLPVTQRQVSQALGLSSALVSSWESGSAIPPEERLNAYARFFATRRSMAQNPPELIPAEDLTAEEERLRGDLIDELVRLREEVLDGPSARPRETGALGGRFWYFPEGQPITILCGSLSQRQLGYTPEAAEAGELPPVVQYATNNRHPNFVRNLSNGDVDALLELVGHIRAENPTADVRWMTYDRFTSVDQVTGHVVILGGGDADVGPLPNGNISVLRAFQDALPLPVDVGWSGGSDDEFNGEFVVRVDAEGNPTSDPDKVAREEKYRPRFLRDEADAARPQLLFQGAPQLRSDVARIVRTRNPLNPSAKLTWFSGIFSRGTYGSVRTFTDATFRARNEQWLINNLDPEDFWLLIQVSVFAGDKTSTPDLTRPANRLRSSQ